MPAPESALSLVMDCWKGVADGGVLMVYWNRSVFEARKSAVVVGDEIMANLCSCALAVVLTAAASEKAQDPNGGLRPDLKEFVIKSVQHNESLVRNFMVRFTVRWYDPNGKPEQMPGHDNAMEERWQYAREANKSYAAGEVDWSSGHKEISKQVFDGERMKFYREDLKSGMVTSRRQYPISSPPDRFTNLYQNVGDLTMSEFLKASTIKKVSSCDIRGSRGFLVELVHKDSTPEWPVEQKIYFDADKGFVPVIVENYPLNVSKDKPTLVAEVQEYEKLSDEVYFPKKARLASYGFADTYGNPQAQWTFRDEVRVETLEVHINTELPKDLFELVFPAGTVIYDETLDRSYNVGTTSECR